MSASQDSPRAAADDRARKVAQVVREYLERPNAADDSAAVIRAHPDLAPELEIQLTRLLRVRHAGQQARDNSVAATAAVEVVPAGDPPPAGGDAMAVPTAVTVRCPHCQSRIELAADVALTDVSCSRCGNHFNLVASDTVTAADGAFVAHFELVRRLGAGQFGEVWLARDHELDRDVAVKLPRKGRLDAWEMEQFLREARAAAQLRHPHIVSVHEVGRDDDAVYIVSEYVDGLDLARWLEGQSLTPREAADMTEKIARALHHAHEAGVVHRDLKPGNILIDVEGEPHIADFGLARRESGEITMTLAGRIVGTPAYMSPEQARGEAHQADCRSDVYALGVILFQLLTGELPFRGNLRMLLAQIIGDEPPEPRRLNARVPLDLQTITLKCLEKSPASRYPTALALADELQRYLEGRPILARPVGRIGRTWRWCLRNPLPAALITLVAFTLCAGTAVSSWFAWQANRRADEARRQVYVTRANLIERDWAAGRTANVVQLLDAQAPQAREDDLRGWEWRYQRRLCHDDVRTFTGHDDTINDAAFSPDGSRLATASWDATVRLWETATGRLTHACIGHTKGVFAVAFSPEGDRLASAGGDGQVILWNTENGAELLRFGVEGSELNDLAWHPDGQRVATCGQKRRVQIWNVEDGAMIAAWEAHASQVYALAYSPDGGRLATCGEDKVTQVWDANSGERLFTCTGHRSGVAAVAFSEDGVLLATGARDGEIRLWDAATGTFKKSLEGHGATVMSVAFDPRGGELASASRDMSVRRWDLDRGTATRVVRGHTGFVTSVAYRRDGRQLATGSYDRTARLWDRMSGQEYRVLKGHTSTVSRIVTLDGNRVATSGWDGTLRVWDIGRGRKLASMSKVNSVFADAAKTTSFFAVATLDGEVARFGIHDRGALPTLSADPAALNSIAASPDGRFLATGDAKGAVTLRNTSDNAIASLRQVHTDAVNALAFSPDGHLLASGGDTRVGFWKVPSLTLLAAIERHRQAVTCVAFAPDGRWLASGSRDHTACLWDVDQRTVVAELHGHENSVLGAAFHPDGTRLATSGADHRLMLWDVESGQLLRRLAGDEGALTSVAFTSDGAGLVAGDADGQVLVWDAGDDSPQARAEREARGLLDRLTGDEASRRETLRTMTGVSDEARELALEWLAGVSKR